MKSFQLNFVLLFCAFASVSCASRSLMLDAPMVSMTKGPKSKGAYTIGKDVKARYCSGDKAVSTSESTVGMIDEVVFLAQKQSNAPYLAEVTIYEVTELFSNPCYELTGKAAK